MVKGPLTPDGLRWGRSGQGRSSEFSEAEIKRARREVRVMQRAASEHLCVCHREEPELSPDRQLMWVTMELVEGTSLGTLLHERGPLEEHSALQYTIQVLKGVEALHRQHLVHRDLKPDNVMLARSVSDEAVIKLIDFGLSRPGAFADEEEDARPEPRAPERDTMYSLHEGGGLQGTVHYMSPEICRGEAADAQSDLWAVGVMLFKLITGSLPFGQGCGSVPLKVMREIVEMKAPPGLLDHMYKEDSRQLAPPSAALDMVLRKCLSAAQEDRYVRARDLREALEMVLVCSQPQQHFHVFISYRVTSDSDLAVALYKALVTQRVGAPPVPMRVYLDKARAVELQLGTRWDSGLVGGLANSAIFMPIISKEALAPLAGRASADGLHASAETGRLNPSEGRDWADVLLAEWMTSLELLNSPQGAMSCIVPVIAGARCGSGPELKFKDFFKHDCFSFSSLPEEPSHRTCQMAKQLLMAVRKAMEHFKQRGGGDRIEKKFSLAGNDKWDAACTVPNEIDAQS
eukprot:gene7082-8447_t